jgi:hypothetical protein
MSDIQRIKDKLQELLELADEITASTGLVPTAEEALTWMQDFVGSIDRNTGQQADHHQSSIPLQQPV